MLPLSQLPRRGAVVVVGSAWLLLALPLPLSLEGWGPGLVALIVALGIGLLRTNGSPLWRRGPELDERELQQRNQSYRLAYRLLGPAVLLLLVTCLISRALHFTRGPSNYWYAVPANSVLGPRELLAFVLLVALLPVGVAAWRNGPAQGSQARLPRRLLERTAAPLAGLLAVLLAWTVILATAPASTVVASQVPATFFDQFPGGCGSYATSRGLGDGLGPALNLITEACWDGRRAWIPKQFHRLACTPALQATDFGTLEVISCGTQRLADGSIRIELRARVGGWLDVAAGRLLAVQLRVDRHGHARWGT
ncbi:MAG: hypothetical protein ACRENX_08130 [Candidatus Dormibacteria bacterium]